MTREDRPVAALIVLIIAASLLAVVAVEAFDVLQMHDCLAAGLKWSNGNCWQEQP